jgi:hypothetical protein
VALATEELNVSETNYCPRAIENGGGPNSVFKPPMNGEMTWREDQTCSYCGSLHPDVFMQRLEAGDVVLGPTDTSYKVYVQDHRGTPIGGPAGKFYFQHLGEAQRARFIELHNEGRLKLDSPGHFYVAPFFCQRVASA